jgi:hypothetical protein
MVVPGTLLFVELELVRALDELVVAGLLELVDVWLLLELTDMLEVLALFELIELLLKLLIELVVFSDMSS